MKTDEKIKNIHISWKKAILRESISQVQEYECYFRLRINANRTDKTLEDILIYIRGINGVTIVRSGETTKRNDLNMYSTKLYIKYTPSTFNQGTSLEDIYNFLEKEIRKFGLSVSLTRLSTPPGEMVSVGD